MCYIIEDDLPSLGPVGNDNTIVLCSKFYSYYNNVIILMTLLLCYNYGIAT